MVRTTQSLIERFRPETAKRVKMIQDTMPVNGMPLRYKAGANFLKSVAQVPSGEALLHFEDDVLFTTRIEDKLATLLPMIPVEDYVLTLYTPLNLRHTPIQQIKPLCFWGNQALYFPAGVVRPLAKFSTDTLVGWKAGDPENDVTPDLLVRRFCIKNEIPIFACKPSLVQHLGGKSTGLNPLSYQHYASAFYEGAAKPYRNVPIESFCTFVTPSYANESRLLFKSLSLFHPGIPIMVIADGQTGTRLKAEFPDLTIILGANENEIQERRERWLSLKRGHCPFNGVVSFKMDVVEMALSRYQNTVFCDADLVFLGPLTDIPDCDLAIAPHYFDTRCSEEDLKYGAYNAGLVFCSSKRFPLWWRARYWEGHPYSDQSMLEDAALQFDFHILPVQTNYGFWRVWNNAIGADAGNILEFTGITVGRGAFLAGKPLQSIHVHWDQREERYHNIQAIFAQILERSTLPEHRILHDFFRLAQQGL